MKTNELEQNICSCNTDPKAQEKISQSTELLKAISDTNRIKILCILSQQRICVCEMADLLDSSHNLISHHLKTLFKAGLLKKKRDGNQIYYYISEEWTDRLSALFTFLDIN